MISDAEGYKWSPAQMQLLSRTPSLLPFAPPVTSKMALKSLALLLSVVGSLQLASGLRFQFYLVKVFCETDSDIL